MRLITLALLGAMAFACRSSREDACASRLDRDFARSRWELTLATPVDDADDESSLVTWSPATGLRRSGATELAVDVSKDRSRIAAAGLWFRPTNHIKYQRGKMDVEIQQPPCSFACPRFMGNSLFVACIDLNRRRASLLRVSPDLHPPEFEKVAPSIDPSSCPASSDDRMAWKTTAGQLSVATVGDEPRIERTVASPESFALASDGTYVLSERRGTLVKIFVATGAEIPVASDKRIVDLMVLSPDGTWALVTFGNGSKLETRALQLQSGCTVPLPLPPSASISWR